MLNVGHGKSVPQRGTWDQWASQGKAVGEITAFPGGMLGVPLADEEELRTLPLEQLQAITSDLQEKLRNRTPG